MRELCNDVRLSKQKGYEHIIKVYDVHSDGKYVFLFMEKCEGNLSDYCDNILQDEQVDEVMTSLITQIS